MEKGRTAMKWLWIFLLTTFGFASKIEILSPVPSPTPTIAVQQLPSISFNNEKFAYAYFTKQNSQTLSLIPNFSHPKDVQTLMAEHSCTSAVNGGFYDTTGKPLGFFYANKHTYGGKIVSPLVNGFFGADASGTPLISTALPDVPYLFALQTGPIILFNGQRMRLTIHNDEHARRMVVGKDTDNRLVFLTVYAADSVFSGPLLSELPSVVESISSKENLGLADALNLDGGSASVFYSGETRLSELTSVGSVFCVE